MLKLALTLSSLFLFIGCTNLSDISSNEIVDFKEQKSIFIDNLWQVENLNNKSIPANVNITLQVAEHDNISGKSGCNQYNSLLTIDENKISIDNIISTRMACSPLLMDSEHLYLNVLASTKTFNIDSDGKLNFFDAQGIKTITFNRVEQAAEKRKPLVVKYSCERDTKLTVSFIEQKSKENKNDVAVVNYGDSKPVTLPQISMASGFLYSNGKFSLRGKGDEASWTLGKMRAMRCKAIK